MGRLLKPLMGLLLLPLCWAATRTLLGLLEAIRPASCGQLPLSAWGLLIGFLLWIILYFVLPRPLRTYVLAHELTHALWALGMGARVSAVKVSKKGGHVKLSKNNPLITLAPYFFPLYTVLVIAAYYLLSLFFDLRAYEPFWLGMVGLTWGFHLTFTLSMLATHQPDIQENGWLFSYALIYLLNSLGISLWIVLVTAPTPQDFGTRFLADVLAVGSTCWEALRAAWTFAQKWMPAACPPP